MPTFLRDSIRGRSLAIEPADGAQVMLHLSLPGLPDALPLSWVRPLVNCDVLLRLLRERGLRTHYVRALAMATAAPQSALRLQEDAAALGLLEPERVSAGALAADAFVVQVEYARGDSTQQAQLRPASWELGAERAGNVGSPPSTRELTAELEPEALRYHAMSAHYRAPLALTQAGLEEAERRIEYLYRTRERLDAVASAHTTDSTEVPEEISSFASNLGAALDDDLDLPAALVALSELLKHVNDLAERAKGKKHPVGPDALRLSREALELVARVLGLGAAAGAPLLARIRGRRAAHMGLDQAELERQIAARVAARAQRDFARADSIRQAISELGVELIDGPDGTRWRLP